MGAQNQAERSGMQDVRNYLVVKRGQCVVPAATRGASMVSTREYRFRICGEHSSLVQVGECHDY